jgi:hypothetical protein
MKILIPVVLFLTSCQILKVKPDTEKGQQLWRLDTVYVEKGFFDCFGSSRPTYVYDRDTCYVYKVAGLTKKYIRIKRK